MSTVSASRSTCTPTARARCAGVLCAGKTSARHEEDDSAVYTNGAIQTRRWTDTDRCAARESSGAS